MTLDQLQQEWEVDSVIDDIHLDNSVLASPKLHSKYLKIMVNTKLKLTQMNSKYNQLKKAKFRYYRGEMSREELKEHNWDQWQGTKPLKSEMDQFLEGDEDLNNLEVKIEYLKTMIYALESILGQIKSRDWEIKSAITWKMFLAGS